MNDLMREVHANVWDKAVAQGEARGEARGEAKAAKAAESVAKALTILLHRRFGPPHQRC